MSVAHWGGLHDAKVIATRDFAATGEAIRTAVRDAGIVLIIGGPGQGKSFACAYHLGRQPLALLSVVASMRPTMRALVGLLYGQLIGEVNPVGTRSRLEGLLVEALGQTPTLLHIDEAQQLVGSGFEVVRSLYDRVPCLPVVFSGGPEFEDVVVGQTMLRSRVVAQHRFAPLSAEDVLEMIPNYHPIYQGVDLTLVLRVNRWAQGRFRQWAIFTQQAAHECKARKVPALTPVIADAVLRRLPEAR